MNGKTLRKIINVWLFIHKKRSFDLKVKELLSKKSRWSKGAFATNFYGMPVEEDSFWASRFCLVGAAIKCYPDEEERNLVYSKIARELKEVEFDSYAVANYINIIWWNDNEKRTFSEVKELVNKLDI